MRRREFIAGLGAAAIASPRAVLAQAKPVIGFLHSSSLRTNEFYVTALRNGQKRGLSKTKTSLSNIGGPMVSPIGCRRLLRI